MGWGERGGVYGGLVGKPEGKRKLGRPGCRWENHIKINLKDLGQGALTGVKWLKIGKTGRFFLMFIGPCIILIVE